MSSSKKSILTGVMLTAGCSIGAGMFSLPVTASGMWFVLSTICLLILWYLSYLSALYILEVNVHFSPGDSFDTLVKNLLGKKWSAISGLSLAFLLYILLYAFYSAFGSILSNAIGNDSIPSGILGLLFGSVFAIIVWYSTKLSGRISTILVAGMVITFIFSMSGYSLQVEAAKLFNTAAENNDYVPYVWAALPYIMTSFGFCSIVPSLYKYYGKDPITIKKSMLIGSLAALVVYVLFLFVVFGNISREAFVDINSAGGNIGVLVEALTQSGDKGLVNTAFSLFSNFAIISSFIGVGLSLLDYAADLFSFPDTPKGRFYSACIAFLPSGILSLFFPNGFIAAIGYAGLVFMFCLFFIPFLMVRKTRKHHAESSYKVKGGNLLLYTFLISSIMIAVFHILAKLKYLPTW
jgi:tryptophan-specific transport protein